MKVKFKFGIATYSGTIDEITFGSYRDDTVCIGRKWVMPRLTENNTQMGSALKNLASIWGSVSSGYKDEMKTYAAKNIINVPKGQLPPTSFSIWIRMMYLFSDMNEGHIDLATVTYSDLQTVAEDILSISVAVENGYLAEVPGYETLTSNM